MLTPPSLLPPLPPTYSSFMPTTKTKQVRALDPPLSTSTLAGILTSAITACVVEGAWEQATDWLTDARMANGGGLPSAAAYAAAANACARAGQGVRARALIAELESGGNGSGNGEAQRPTLECYNAVVLGCAMGGDMKGALQTLKVEVPEAGLKPDTRGFNHVIQGYAKLKDWRMALTLLDEQRSGETGLGARRRHARDGRRRGGGERTCLSCLIFVCLQLARLSVCSLYISTLCFRAKKPIGSL